MNASIKHVDFLDHARGIAVLSVFIFHCFGMAFVTAALPWSGRIQSFVLQKSVVTPALLTLLPAGWGWAGVPIFFVVSGFCIHMSFQQQGKQWGNFFIRRFFRIYPPYLASVFFCELLKHKAMLHNTDGVAQWLTHLLLIHNFGPATLQGINPVFWSIAVEVQLYLIYPILLALVSRLGWSKAIFIAFVFEFSIRSFEGASVVISYGATTGTFCRLLSVSPFGYWFSWSIGALIADAVLQGKPVPLGNVSPFLWAILAVETSLIKPLTPFSFMLFSLAAAAAISRKLSGTLLKIGLPKIILMALRQAGIWSYSIYLLHFPLLNIFMQGAGVLGGSIYNYPIVFFLLCVMTGLPIALICMLWYKWFELPGISWGKQMIVMRGRNGL